MWWFGYKKTKSQITMSRKPKRVYPKETIGVALAVVLLFLALALFGYHPDDATWFSFSSNATGIFNWCGSFGAHSASLLLHFFGSSAYLLLFALGAAVYFLLSAQEQDSYRFRMISLPFFVVAASVICHLYDIDIVVGFYGGLFGELLFELTEQALGPVGVPLFWWSVLVLSFSLIINLSLFKLASWIAAMIMAGVKHMMSKIADFLQRKWLWCKMWLLRINKYLVESGDLYMLLERRRLESDNDDHPAVKKEAFVAAVSRDTSQLHEGDLMDVPLHPHMLIKPLIESQEMLDDGLVKTISMDQNLPFQLPDLTLFNPNKDDAYGNKISKEAYSRSEKLKEKLEHFGLNGLVTAIRPGPLITMFEYQPEISSKISKITALEDDLAMALSAVSIRTIAPIPGKNAVGFEISNKDRKNVYFSDAINSDQFTQSTAKLPLALGVDVVGNPIVYDLLAMPHLLIGGTTGSGKSVGLNSMLASLLCRCTPEQLRIILIDPKRLEFTPYADIPHLLFPIVTNAGQATVVLKWVVQEMEDRYERMSNYAVRNVIEYQQLVAKQGDSSLQPMPFIAVIIDELADLMVVAGKEIETHIVRIAQMARAAGIHLIVATQRPSVDVVTGLIKVNFPSRVAFRVASKVDSRTILDQSGAEKLLGQGDMLFMHSSSPHLIRIHGAYISDQEIEVLTKHLREQAPVQYLDLQNALDAQENKKADSFEDTLYPQIITWVDTLDEVSISMLQRQFRIGFNRSARIIEQLEIDAKVSPAQGSKARKVIK